MKAYLKALGIDFNPLIHNVNIEKHLLSFGMDATKYARILPKALAFRSIDLQPSYLSFY